MEHAQPGDEDGGAEERAAALATALSQRDSVWLRISRGTAPPPRSCAKRINETIKILIESIQYRYVFYIRIFWLAVPSVATAITS